MSQPSPILQAIGAIALGRIKRCAVVTWVQDLWPESLVVTGYVRSPSLLRAVSWVVRWIYQRCDLLLVQSEAFTDRVLPLAGQTPVRYHPNPGEVAAQDIGKIPAEPGVDSAAPALRLQPGFNLVFAGNLGMAQALDSVLDAAELLQDLPDFRLVLVGRSRQSARSAHWTRTAPRCRCSAGSRQRAREALGSRARSTRGSSAWRR